MRIILITSCSNRKAIPPRNRLQASELPSTSLKTYGEIWRRRLKSQQFFLPARDLYIGRGAKEARKAADTVQAKQWFVSAGLGLVSGDEEVPGYDLTISGNSGNHLKHKIPPKDYDLARWWNEISRRHKPKITIPRLVERNKDALIILAVPRTYYLLIARDLGSLSRESVKNLRLIGVDKSVLPQHLQSLRLPYDARLDGPESRTKGTKSDFPQRAARHFLESIWIKDPDGDAIDHINAVEKNLSKYSYPSVPCRTKLSDQEILALISELWTYADGKSSRMLRILRDEKLIACEQGRFKFLFNSYKEKIGTIV